MANKKLTDLPILESLSDDDLFYVVDVSDLTESGEGTSKKVRLKSDLTDVLKYATASAFPLTGVVGKLYYDIATDLYYKWDGATYEEFGAGGTATIVTKTKAEIDTLISGNDLVPLTVYEITGVDTALYGGSTIYLQAITDNTLAVDGIGKFFNPKYNQAVSGFDVWTSSGTYAIGDKVHWGGKTWTNVNGNVGTSTDLFTLDSEWNVISFNSTDYNVVYDAIKYDYANDVIIYRNEQNSNIVSFDYGYQLGRAYGSPIKNFMWGNKLDANLYVGIGNQNIINSYNQNINFRGLYQAFLNFYNNSNQINCSFENGSYQDTITLVSSTQQDFIFNNSSQSVCQLYSSVQIYITLLNSNQFYLTLINKSTQAYINLENNSNQDTLYFNNSSQQHLTESTGFDQKNITFNNFTISRASSPMIADEDGLVFQGDLPTSTTATKMIVKEDNQLKEMDIPSGGSGSTNLSTTYAPTTVTIVSSSGTDATVTAVDGTNAGVVTPTQKSQWDGKQDALGFTPYNATNPSGYQTLGEVLSRIDDAIQDTPYDATGWDGVTDDAPSMNSVRDKFVLVDSAISSKYDASNPSGYQTASQVQAIADAKVSDTAYNTTSWNAVTDIAPSKNAIRDKFESTGLTEILAVNNTTAQNIIVDVSATSGVTAITATTEDAVAVSANANLGTAISGNSAGGVAGSFFTQLGNTSNIVDFSNGGTSNAFIDSNAKLTATDLKATNQTASTIASFDADKNVVSLSTATYPSLTELTYSKGVTSAIQTQLNGKSNTGHTHTASEVTDFNSATRAQTEAELVAGSNITITPSGTGATRQLTIASTGGGATNLDDLGDVTITTPTTDQVLKYNGSAWVNGTASGGSTTTTGTYTGTIVVTATTAPTGATNHSFAFEESNGVVELRLNIDFATSGTGVTSIACELPSGAPTPALPTGVSATGDVLVYGTGTLTANRALVGGMGICGLRLKSTSPNVFEVVVTRTSGTYQKAYLLISYFK